MTNEDAILILSERHARHCGIDRRESVVKLPRGFRIESIHGTLCLIAYSNTRWCPKWECDHGRYYQLGTMIFIKSETEYL